MKKILLSFAALLLIVSCSKEHDLATAAGLELYGYSDMQAGRTAFDTPTATAIPLLWSAGDYVWLEGVKSSELNEGCQKATFSWNPAPTVNGAYHLYYNMTNAADPATAYVLAEQTADGNLGNDGDFGHATADAFGFFTLQHKCAYIWFDTTTDDIENNNLVSITVTAAVDLAGKCTYNPTNDSWGAVTEGSQSIVLNFGQEGVALQASNAGVFAAMVTLPAAISGQELTIRYTFADGATYTETKTPAKNFEGGKARRIATKIKADDLVQPEPELSYELRVLTFEDEDVKFDPIEDFAFAYPDYMGGYWYGDYFTLTKWSDYIPRDGQYGNGHRSYEWYDANNTELEFVWPSEDSFWGIAGHAGISDYVGTMDDVNGFHDDNMLYMIDLQAYNVKGGANGSKNFCSQYGYLDPDEYATIYSPEGVLPGIQFHDGVARVIDHMYVTNTTYAYGVIIHGECDFGGSFQLTDASTFKIVAYGYDSFDDTEPTITDFYLLNTGQRFVTDWTKWDLSVLGKVVRVEFNLVACDNGYGKYGLVIPAYFAYDDVAVRFEK